MMKKPARIYLAGVLTLTLACASAPQTPEQRERQAEADAHYSVILTENSQMTTGCKFIASINSGFAGYKEQAEDALRKQAHSYRANVVFIGPSGVGRSSMSGEAYACPEKAPPPAPTPSP